MSDSDNTSPVDYSTMFSIAGKVAAITGGGGILCGEMARALATLGAKVAVLDLDEEAAQRVAAEVSGADAIGVKCNVLEVDSIQAAYDQVASQLGPVDVLINGAGGNNPRATTGGTTIAEQIDPTFFDLEPAGVQFVFNLNFLGTLLPTQVFAKPMVERGAGSVINISSMNAFRPLRVFDGLLRQRCRSKHVGFIEYLSQYRPLFRKLRGQSLIKFSAHLQSFNN